MNNIISYIEFNKTFFQKQYKKNNSETQLDEKNLPLHDVIDHFAFLYFSTARQAAFAL